MLLCILLQHRSCKHYQLQGCPMIDGRCIVVTAVRAPTNNAQLSYKTLTTLLQVSEYTTTGNNRNSNTHSTLNSSQSTLLPNCCSHDADNIQECSFMKLSWNFLNFSTKVVMTSSRGKIVVRRWKVPSSCPKPDPGTVLMPVASSSLRQ
mmetsp:Transcript_13690/g.29383  ORF Transcript_13690/g.29383 Transcript_13690/m.29383 type:complete len:149 (-) Transcript_13690:1434-1880(-)